MVLFFRLPFNNIWPEEPVEFSATSQVARLFYITIPSIALIWYLLLKAKSIKEWGISLPKKQDFVAFFISLPALILVSATVFFVSSHLDKSSFTGPRLLPPQDFVSWIVLVVSCVFSAFLEESYFRFYLLSKHEDMKINTHIAVLMSTILFSCCHIYEGPWGFLNSAISAVVLAYSFLRFRSLYGIVLAHAVYNVLAYVIGAA